MNNQDFTNELNKVTKLLKNGEILLTVNSMPVTSETEDYKTRFTARGLWKLEKHDGLTDMTYESFICDVAHMIVNQEMEY